MNKSAPSSGGFTLVETLVVIATMGLLMSILLPSLARAREYAHQTVCAANLRTLGLATNMYLDENEDRFFRYYTQIASGGPGCVYPGPGRLWWFGFEINGPGGGANRPLDKSLSPLASYTANLDTHLQCPDFPYTQGYFPKFNQHAASYGVNLTLAPANGPTASRREYVNRSPNVFVFADGIHFDFNPGFNEGHYIQYTSPLTLSGYAHFRHLGRAQYVMLDGHVDSQKLAGPAFRTIDGGPAGNLVSDQGTNSIYGF